MGLVRLRGRSYLAMLPLFHRRLPAPGGIAMIHPQLSAALKDAMKAKDDVALRTVRLILAALKDRDIAARGRGNPAGIEDDEILGLLLTMIKQRREGSEEQTSELQSLMRT